MNLRASPHLLSRSALAVIGLTILLALSSVFSVSASTAKDAQIDARIAKTQEFVATIKGRDLDAANALFDLFAFTERVAQHLRLEGDEKRAFTKGFYQGLQEQNLVSEVFRMALYDNAQIGYKHITSNAYLKDTPVIRMDYQAGAIEFVMPVFDDDLNIVDFFIGSRGNFSSIGVARMASLMSKPSGPQLESLFDINFVDASLVGAIGEIVGAYSQNEFALAYEKLEALPPEVKNTRALLDFAVGLAQTVSEEQYIEKLSALYEHHGDDPSAAFVLIDYHFYNQDFEKVLASIDSAMILVGKDGALLHLKGAYLVMMGLDKQGRAFVEESIEVDPELMSAYWTLASIQNQAKEFEQLTQTLATIESQFDLSIKPEELRANPSMADYVKSEAFKNAFPGG